MKTGESGHIGHRPIYMAFLKLFFNFKFGPTILTDNAAKVITDYRIQLMVENIDCHSRSSNLDLGLEAFLLDNITFNPFRFYE